MTNAAFEIEPRPTLDPTGLTLSQRWSLTSWEAEARLCDHFVALAASCTGAEQVSVMLCRGDALQVVGARGHERRIVGERMAHGRGAAWAALTGGRPIHIHGACSSGRGFPEYSLLVPIQMGSHPVGTLNLGKKSEAFTEREGAWARVLGWLLGEVLQTFRLGRLALALRTPVQNVLRAAHERICAPSEQQAVVMSHLAETAPPQKGAGARDASDPRGRLETWCVWAADLLYATLTQSPALQTDCVL